MDTTPPPRLINMWALAGELGFLIALPLVLLMLGAIKIDQRLHTAPLFMILAIVIAPFLSGIAIWRKIKRLSPPSEK